MRKLSLLFGIILCLSLGATAADDPAPTPVPAPVDQHPAGYIFSPDRGRVQGTLLQGSWLNVQTPGPNRDKARGRGRR